MVKQFRYKLYAKPKNKHLHRLISLHGRFYNHCIGLHNRYYRLFGKHLNQYALMRHVTKLKKISGFEWIAELGSQSVQDVIERIEKGYALFFSERKAGNKKIRPPTFRKVKKYTSFTLKQAGWKLVQDNIIRIDGRTHKFALSRPIEGVIKTVTIKRDAVGELWVSFACQVETRPGIAATGETPTQMGASAGIDFGLKTFLTFDGGETVQSPQFFKRGKNAIGRANRVVSRRQIGSKGRAQAVKHLARAHREVANQRRDWQWKTAREIAQRYDQVWIEDLNLRGMKALWGRKVSDLAYGDFVLKLDYLLASNGKQLGKRDRFLATSKTHFECGYVKDYLTLADREWTCPQCGGQVERDVNAARMIKHGRAMSWSTDRVSRALPALVVNAQESPCL